jgi:hypothetical protein
MRDDLFLAILSLDAYNRGYAAGLEVTGTQIGTAIVGDNSAVLGNVSPNNRLDQSVSFFAQSYTGGDGQAIISYRGTNADEIQNFVANASHGYSVAIGSPYSIQAEQAVNFYRTVAGLDVDPRTANIAVTGHSLGAASQDSSEGCTANQEFSSTT